MGVTEFAAWLGAITGTTALVWNFIKWTKGGPSLRIRVNPNMSPGQAPPGTPPGPWTLVRVSNVGDQPTTLLALSFEVYSSHWSRLGRRPVESFAVFKTSRPPLPKRLEVGEDWATIIRPDARIPRALDGALLYVAAKDAHRKRPTRVRVER